VIIFKIPCLPPKPQGQVVVSKQGYRAIKTETPFPRHLLFPLNIRTIIILSASICSVAVTIAAFVSLVLATFDQSVPLQRILSREALATKCARERLDRKMDSLVPLQIVVPAEGLDALIALERSLGLRRSLTMPSPIHHRMPILWDSHSRNHRHLTTRLVDVGHNG
jgi:hypothetical protein